MSSFYLVPHSRVDVPVRVKARHAATLLNLLGQGRPMTDDAALELIANVIADLVMVERYLSDPRVRWAKDS